MSRVLVLLIVLFSVPRVANADDLDIGSLFSESRFAAQRVEVPADLAARTDHATQFLRDHPDDPHRAEVQLALARYRYVALASATPEERITILKEVEQLAGAAADDQPQAPYAAAARMLGAYAAELRGAPDAARTGYERLLHDYGDHPLAAVCRWRLADLLAAKGLHDAALDQYQRLARDTETAGPDLRLRLAKNYRQLGNEEAALDLLHDVLGDATWSDRAVREAAACLASDHPGAYRAELDRAAAYLATDPTRLGDLFGAMAGRYAVLNNGPAVVAARRRQLDGTDLHGAATVYPLLLEALAQYGDAAAVAAAQAAFIDRFPERSTEPAMAALQADALYATAITTHRRAQRHKEARIYGDAAAAYRRFQALFPDDARIAATRFPLAEALDRGGDLTGAIAAYDRVAAEPDHAQRQAAAYGAIAALDRLRAADPSQASAFRKRCRAFVRDYPTANQRDALLLKWGDAALTAFATDEAVEVAQALTAAGLARQASDLYLGHLAGPYLTADRLAEIDTLLAVLPGGDERSTHLAATVTYRRAQALERSGKRQEAAALFAALRTSQDADMARRAAQAVAINLASAGDAAAAAAAYLHYADHFPAAADAMAARLAAAALLLESGAGDRGVATYTAVAQDTGVALPERIEALDRLARHAEGRYDFVAAGRAREEMARLLPDDSARDPLFTAALWAVRRRAPEEAERLFAAYLDRFGDRDPRAAVAYYEWGAARLSRNRLSLALEPLTRAVRLAKSSDPVLAGRATYLQGEVYRRKATYYPLKDLTGDALKQRFQDQTEWLAAGKEAYERAVRSADPRVATAAWQGLAQLYEGYANAIIEAPVPASLAGEAADRYRAAVRTKVAPYFAEAETCRAALARQSTTQATLWLSLRPVETTRSSSHPLVAEAEP